MKWNQVIRDWPSVSQHVKSKWGKLTDADLTMIAGQRDTFVALFKQRYGDSQTDAERKIDSFVLGLKAQEERSKILLWPQRFWENIRSYRYAKPRI